MLLNAIWLYFISAFYSVGLFQYPVKILTNQRFSNVFRGYRKRPVTWNELKWTTYTNSVLSGKTISLIIELRVLITRIIRKSVVNFLRFLGKINSAALKPIRSWRCFFCFRDFQRLMQWLDFLQSVFTDKIL